MIFPYTLRSLGLKQRHYSIVLMIIRTVNLFFLPAGLALYYSNGCGNYWVHYWETCAKPDLRSQLDVSINPGQWARDHNLPAPYWVDEIPDAQLLSSHSICDVQFLHHGKCAQEFLYFMNNLALQKLFFSAFASPLLLLIITILEGYDLWCLPVEISIDTDLCSLLT